MDAKALATILHLLRDDPNRFNDLVLCRGAYWSKQVEICEALCRYKTVVVATGNSIGKSFLGAGIIAWWLYTRPGAQVVATAPSQTLLGTVLYKELRKAIRRARAKGVPLPGRVTDSANASPQMLTIDAAGWYSLGISTTSVERISGQHAGDLLQVIDEGSGIEEAIWEGLDSQSPSKRLILGNPLTIDTKFHQAYLLGLKQRDDPEIPDHRKTVSIRIESTEGPDVHLERSPVGLADATWLAEMEETWGKESLWWRTHIQALFPESSTEALIPIAWIEAACSAPRTRPTHWESVSLSIDIAAGVDRDRTVILVRDYYGVLELVQSATMEIPEAARVMHQLCGKWRIPADRIVYDANGIGRDLPPELEIYGIRGCFPYFGGSKQGGGSRFSNLRTRCGWALRKRLDPKRRKAGELPAPPPKNTVRRLLPGADPSEQAMPVRQAPFHIPMEAWTPALVDELKMLKYFNVDSSKIGLELKKDLVKRIGRSPDLADALIMSEALGDEAP